MGQKSSRSQGIHKVERVKFNPPNLEPYQPLGVPSEFEKGSSYARRFDEVPVQHKGKYRSASGYWNTGYLWLTPGYLQILDEFGEPIFQLSYARIKSWAEDADLLIIQYYKDEDPETETAQVIQITFRPKNMEGVVYHLMQACTILHDYYQEHKFDPAKIRQLEESLRMSKI